LNEIIGNQMSDDDRETIKVVECIRAEDMVSDEAEDMMPEECWCCGDPVLRPRWRLPGRRRFMVHRMLSGVPGECGESRR